MANICKYMFFTIKRRNRFGWFRWNINVQHSLQKRQVQREYNRCMQTRVKISVVITLLTVWTLHCDGVTGQERSIVTNNNRSVVSDEILPFNVLLNGNKEFRTERINENNSNQQSYSKSNVQYSKKDPIYTTVERTINCTVKTLPCINTSQIHHRDNVNDSVVEVAKDIENEVFPFGNRGKADANLLPDCLKHHSKRKNTEDLAESIINAVKTETEIKQFAESPSLKFLREIPEPEIRDKLLKDLDVDSHIYERFFPRKQNKNQEADQQEPVEEHVKYNKNTTRQIRQLNFQQSALKQHVNREYEKININENEVSNVTFKVDFISSINNEDGVSDVAINHATTEHFKSVKTKQMDLKIDPEGSLFVVLDEPSVTARWTDNTKEPQHQQNEYDMNMVPDDNFNEVGETTKLISNVEEHFVIKKVLHVSDMPVSYRESYDSIKDKKINKDDGSFNFDKMIEGKFKSPSKKVMVRNKKCDIIEEPSTNEKERTVMSRRNVTSSDKMLNITQHSKRIKDITSFSTMKSLPSRNSYIQYNTNTEKLLEPITLLEVKKHGRFSSRAGRKTIDILEPSSLNEGTFSIFPAVNNMDPTTFEPNNGHPTGLKLFGDINEALTVRNRNSVSNKSTIIILLSLSSACIFLIISVAIFFISFQRQQGTLDIEMQERKFNGKNNLNGEDAETFSKLLKVELQTSALTTPEETDECFKALYKT